jgi:hypothetical protein
MKVIVFLVILICVDVCAHGQITDTIIANNNVVGIKTGYVYNQGHSYLMNPYYLRKFKYINGKAGLFYSSDVLKHKTNYHVGINLGGQILFFKKSKLVRPYSEIMLLAIGTSYDIIDNRYWKWGGGVFLGNGVEFKVRRFAIGVGMDFGVVGYYPSSEGIDKSMVLWITPTLHFSHSFK